MNKFLNPQCSKISPAEQETYNKNLLGLKKIMGHGFPRTKSAEDKKQVLKIWGLGITD